MGYDDPQRRLVSDDEHRLTAVEVGDLLELPAVPLDHLDAGLATPEPRVERAGPPLLADRLEVTHVEGMGDDYGNALDAPTSDAS